MTADPLAKIAWPLAAFWMLAFADYALTLAGLRAGVLVELNPVMAWAYGHGDELALVVKGVIYGAVVFGVLAIARTRSGAGVAWAAAAVLALVVAYTAVGLVIA